MIAHYRNFTRYLLVVCFLLSFISCKNDKKTVLFEEGHGQLFKIIDSKNLGLSKLSTIFQNDAWTVETSNSEITDELLNDIDALVITGAFKSITQNEIGVIKRFLEKGGKLAVMLHIGPPVAALLHNVNVSISNGVIHETGNLIIGNDIDFKVVNLNIHELTNNLNDFTVYGGWALLPTDSNGHVVAQTSTKSWIDLNGDNKADAQQSFATIVVGTFGLGEFVVFSDDAIFQNMFLKENNYELAQNLVQWLAN